MKKMNQIVSDIRSFGDKLQMYNADGSKSDVEIILHAKSILKQLAIIDRSLCTDEFNYLSEDDHITLILWLGSAKTECESVINDTSHEVSLSISLMD